MTSLNDTSAPHAREHLRAREHLPSCLHLTNPCAKRKVLSLTKPKGKTYKTKSFGHYITPKRPPDDKKFQRYTFSQLSSKLSRLLNDSKWKYIGRPEMVLNQTNFRFSTTEMEALSLGLKFATCIYKSIIINTKLENYRICDTDFSWGFIQGIILAAISQPNESSHSKRYTQA